MNPSTLNLYLFGISFTCLMIDAMLLNLPPKVFVSSYFIILPMSSYLRTKQISTREKDLINGYIREYQNKLFGTLAEESPYYNIPQLINICCMAFYEVFTWYKEKHGERLEFISDKRVRVKKEDIWSVCLYETEISNKICDKFDITFKVISFGIDRRDLDFCIGYATGDTLETSIENWEECIGEDNNKQTSAAWAFWESSLVYNGFCEYETSDSDMNYSPNDLLRLLFDFKTNKVKIYQNGEEKDCKDLGATKFWIGLSLRYQGTEIEMVEYKYD